MRWIIAATTALLLLLTGCGATGAETDSRGAVASGAGDLQFTATTLEGDSFDGATLAGQPAVLWFWSPWCPTCLAQSDNVAALADTYAGQVSVVGVGGLDDQEAIDEVAVGIDSVNHLVDVEGTVWKHFRVTQQSTYTILDATGQIVHEGYLDDEELNEMVAELATQAS